jgi:D-alanyl-D-alanine carboxypeptidase/D-alanyl-D-alanine-endopeptidase (penicillin-binding protein 4)
MKSRATLRWTAVILGIAALICTLESASAWAGPGRASTNASSAAPKKNKKTPMELATERFAGRAQTLLTTGSASKGEWGLLVQDAETGATVYELNADKLFVPASNMKIFTTALGLAKLGSDFRFHTTVETRGVLSENGVLTGDLILVGRGDPNLSNRKLPFALKEEFDGPPEKVLAELADALVKKGVHEIAGDVVGDDSYFPPERYPSGWEVDDIVWRYGAAISAIVVDDNTVEITLTPGELAGDAVTAATVPATPDFVVKNEVVTSAAEVKAELTLTRDPGSRVVVVRGTLPARSTPRKLVLAVQEPAEHAAALLQRLLVERGVQISGTARAVHIPEAPGGVPRAVFAEHLSAPLRDTIGLVNKISQNLHTEMLLRAAARENGMWNAPEDLFKFAADFYAAAGIAVGDVIQTDGSGLSRRDLVAPRAIATLLKYAQAQPWFGIYFASLPVAGIDGTLDTAMKNTVASGRIHAKTGSVEHVRTRSGYAELPNGKRLIFSFLGNNQGGNIHDATATLDALCVAMMEEFDVKAGSESRVKKH